MEMIKIYSHEIEELLRIRNNLVTLQEYKWIALSPQIVHIKFENEEFKIKTSDGYKFTLKIWKGDRKI